MHSLTKSLLLTIHLKDITVYAGSIGGWAACCLAARHGNGFGRLILDATFDDLVLLATKVRPSSALRPCPALPVAHTLSAMLCCRP